tara:strand:+ start:95 stop:388 length:294 start_codon:yes stop_codon:yes gene_type:complete
MSWDFDISKESFNYTYNVASMFLSCDSELGIRVINKLTGKQALPILRRLRNNMEDNEDAMLLLEPDNGWGNYEGALHLVNKLIKASIDNKRHKWEVS